MSFCAQSNALAHVANATTAGLRAIRIEEFFCFPGRAAKTIVVAGFSGGKDSELTAALALEKARSDESIQVIVPFFDVGNENKLTYEHVRYLEGALGIKILWLRADLRQRVIDKREVVATKWRRDGVPEETIERALRALTPTGNPFLDLCLWKGRFPSRKAKFCTEQLKKFPAMLLQSELGAMGYAVESWQGVRGEESPDREALPEEETTPEFVLIRRPIHKLKAHQVFAELARRGLKPNPLYTLGMGRVGCMPCIECSKGELFEIQRRFPEEIARIAEWEKAVSEAAKHGAATFFAADKTDRAGLTHDEVKLFQHGIYGAVEWSMCSHGSKRQFDFKMLEPVPACSSIYGLCE